MKPPRVQARVVGDGLRASFCGDVTKLRDYRTALVIIPPGECAEKLQQFRKDHDPAHPRWMPSVHLLWPFINPQAHPHALDKLRRTAAHLKPLKVEVLGPVYPKKKELTGRSPIYLPVRAAETAFSKRMQSEGRPDGLLVFRRKLAEAFAELEPRESYRGQLNVGLVPRYDIRYIAEELPWEPVTFPVNELHVIRAPSPDAPFEIIESVPLGAAWG